MRDLIFAAEGTLEEVINKVIVDLNELLLQKRKVALWKIDSVCKAFKEQILAKSDENPKLFKLDVEVL